MENSSFVLGHDSRAVGRWSRLVLGVLGVWFAIARALEVGVLAETGFYVLVIAAAYVAAHRLLSGWVLGKMNPWVATIVLVGPAIVIPGVAALPTGLRLGMIAYFSVSLLLNASKSYGGCEVLALPSLLFRRWYTVYCPLNVIDAIERRVAGEAGARGPETA